MTLPANLQPTPYPDVNALLGALLPGARAILGPRLIGFYLDGSLALGGFDQDSDIDFVAVVDGEISQESFLALQAMHDRLAALDTPWAIQLEGSYMSRTAVRRHDPAFTRYPNIERGRRERLKWVDHGPWWNIHRWVLRERGITLLGPDPRALVDPVTPEVLRAAALADLTDRKALLADPSPIHSRGYQSYIVLTMCRICYTLEHGTIASKLAAARWFQSTQDPRWGPLIERAWEGRHASSGPSDPADRDETLELVRYMIERAGM